MRITEKDDPVRQLMCCGISKERATRICQRFANEEDAGGLRNFVRYSEAICDDRKQHLEE